MNVRTKVLLGVGALFALSGLAVVLITALAFWLMTKPVTTIDPVAEASQPAVVVDDTLTADEYIFQGAKYTRRSPNEPDGLPAVHPYGGLNRSGQAAIPVETEPAIWMANWQEGLTGEQVTMYARGLVRSGLEDLHMCKSGYTCHATVNYEVYEQNRSDLPHILTLHMSFTTPTQHKELFLLVEGGRGKVWSMTASGWNFTGVVEDLPENEQNMVYKLMCSSHLDDMKY